MFTSLSVKLRHCILQVAATPILLYYAYLCDSKCGPHAILPYDKQGLIAIQAWAVSYSRGSGGQGTYCVAERMSTPSPRSVRRLIVPAWWDRMPGCSL
eukprot:scaffold86993_cov40-Prasinocladus_malaysianus.AAC.3